MDRGDPGGSAEAVLFALEWHGCAPRERIGGWRARCPAHDDRKPSLDALAPDQLRRLYADAVDEFWDESEYELVMDSEREERQALREFAGRWSS